MTSSGKGDSSGADSFRSGSSIGNGLLTQFRESAFELLLGMNSQKRFWMDRWLLILLEIFSLFAFFMNTVKCMLTWENDSNVERVSRYLFQFMDPTINMTNFVSYTIIFLIACGWVCCGTGIMVFVAQKKTSNELLCFLCFWFCRLSRTILLYPLLYVFFSPMRCDIFGGSFEMENFESLRCTEFPFLLFWIVGLLLMVVVILVGSIDSLFQMDKFKGLDLFTSAPDGRFTTFIYMIQVVSFLLIELFKSQEVDEAVIGSVSLTVFLLLLSLLVLIRFIPFFHFQYVCMVASVLVIIALSNITLLVLLVTREWWVMFMIVSVVIGLVLTWMLLCLRYYLLYRFFRKNKIRSNIFLCYLSVDIIIGIYVKDKISRLFSCCTSFKSIIPKKKNKIVPYDRNRANLGNTDMLTVISELLNDEDFEKTKNLCQLLASLTFESNPRLTKMILNHTSTIMRSDLMDVELSLEFYLLQTTNVQHVGGSNNKTNRKKKLKLVSELGRASRREDDLRILIHMLLDVLSAEDGKVSFTNIPNFLTSIQVNCEFCEGVYSKLVRVSPCSRSYHAYARYLSRFHNDRFNAHMYIREAKQLEFSQARRSDHSDIVGRAGGRNNSYVDIVIDHADEEERGRRSFEPSDNGDNHTVEDEVSDVGGGISSSDDDDDESAESADQSDHNGSDGSNSNSYENEIFHDSTTYNSQHSEVADDDSSRIPGKVKKEEEEERQSESDVGNKLENNNNTTDKSLALREEGNSVVSIDDHETSRTDGDGTDIMTDDVVGYNGGKSEMSDFGDGVSYTKKDSVITKVSASSSGVGSQRHLKKKVERGNYCSTYLTRGICCVVFIISVVVVLLLFSMSFVLHYDFKNSADTVVLASSLQESVTEGAHFLRKLQISMYDSENTPLAYERQPDVFAELVRERCDRIRDYTRELYSSMSVEQARPWDDITMMLTEHLLSVDEDSTKNEYFVEDYSLLNGVSLYGEKCMKFYVDFPKYAEVYGTVNYTVGNRIQDDESFIFVTMNESPLHDGLDDLIIHLVSYEENQASDLMLVYILVPCCISLVFPLIFIVWCVYKCEQRKTFKGFFLIPKEEINEIREKIDHGTGTNWTSEGTKKRVDTTNCSLINRFVWLMCLAVAIILIVSSVFTVLGVLTCDRFVERNREFYMTLEVSVLSRRVHMMATELVYRDDTLFEDEVVAQWLSDDMEVLAEVYDAIRSGSEDGKVKGNDKQTIPNKIYYDENCDTTIAHDHVFDYLSCLPLTQKIELMIQNGEDLLRTNYTIKETARSDEHYQNLILLDNFNNGSYYDRGAIQDQLNEIEEYVSGRVDSYLSYIQSFSLLLLILFLPIFSGIYCVIFWSYPTRLKRNLTMVRRMMLLMSNSVILRKEIYDYVSGRSNFKVSFEKEKKNRVDIICSAFQHQSYGMIIFNKKLVIIRYNTTANELFNIKACGAHKISELFDEKDFQKVRKFVNSSKKKVLNGELMAKYDDQKYCVLADFSRGDDENGIFCGVFENLESSKKKDLLKEAERRDDKTEQLIQNILPKEIAKSMKIEDLLKGNCMISEHKKATAYFSDICDFTGLSQRMEVNEIIEMLHDFFSQIDDICDEYKLEKIKTIGDCYFAISGIPTYKPLHAKTAMDFAIAVLKMVNGMNKSLPEGRKIYIRTGLSSGKLVAGVIGKRKFTYDTWGPMINEAARMEHHGFPGKIMVSRATYESIHNIYNFMERDVHLQGIGVCVKAYVYTPKFMNESELTRKEMSCKENKMIRISSSGIHDVKLISPGDVAVMKRVVSKGTVDTLEEEEEEEEEEELSKGDTASEASLTSSSERNVVSEECGGVNTGYDDVEEEVGKLSVTTTTTKKKKKTTTTTLPNNKEEVKIVEKLEEDDVVCDEKEETQQESFEQHEHCIITTDKKEEEEVKITPVPTNEAVLIQKEEKERKQEQQKEVDVNVNNTTKEEEEEDNKIPVGTVVEETKFVDEKKEEDVVIDDEQKMEDE